MSHSLPIQMFLKRQFDIWVSLAALLVLSPLFLLIAVLTKITSKGAVFFVQERPGKDMKMFDIIKFRTMASDAHKLGLDMREDNQMITGLGKFLRRWHLDEMPQIINILKGEMSLVGPRPPLMSQLNLDNPGDRKRFSMKPGMAGWAQLKGGNWISWDDRVRYDVWYVEHWSLWLDIKIFFLSFWKIILKGEGLYVPKGKSGRGFCL